MRTRRITNEAELQELQRRELVARYISRHTVLELSEMTQQEMTVIVTRKPRYGKVVLTAGRGYNEVYEETDMLKEKLLFVSLNFLPSVEVFIELCPEEVTGYTEHQVYEALNYRRGAGKKILCPQFFKFSFSKKNYERVKKILPFFICVPATAQSAVQKALTEFSKDMARIDPSGLLTSLQEA